MLSKTMSSKRTTFLTTNHNTRTRKRLGRSQVGCVCFSSDADKETRGGSQNSNYSNVGPWIVNESKLYWSEVFSSKRCQLFFPFTIFGLHVNDLAFYTDSIQANHNRRGLRWKREREHHQTELIMHVCCKSLYIPSPCCANNSVIIKWLSIAYFEQLRNSKVIYKLIFY